MRHAPELKRATEMANAVVTGEKLETFVIAQSRTPHCLRHIKNFLMKIPSPKEKLDNQWDIWGLGKENWSSVPIALLIDNCLTQWHVKNLTNVNLVVWPNSFYLCDTSFTANGSRCYNKMESK